MIILKWTLIVVAVAYVGGLAALFLLQRAVLFPIPTRERVAPAAAGFPQVEEHVLITDDGGLDAPQTATPNGAELLSPPQFHPD